MEEIKKELSKRKDIMCSWAGDLILLGLKDAKYH